MPKQTSKSVEIGKRLTKNYKEFNVLCKDLTVELRKYLQDESEDINITNESHMQLVNLVNSISNDTNSSEYTGGDNYDDQLIKLYKGIIEEYLKHDIDEVVGIIDSEEFLLRIHKQFSNAAFYIHRLQLVFNYLDQFKLKGSEGVDCTTVAFSKYKEYYWQTIEDKRLYQEINHLHFKKLRQGMVIPYAAVKTIIDMYSKIGFKKKGIKTKKDHTTGKIVTETDFEDCQPFYKKQFEDFFKQSLDDYFMQKIREWSSLTVPEYVDQVNQALENEDKYCDEYYPNSKEIFMTSIQDLLISKQAQSICENTQSGALHQLNENQQQNLSSLYKLFTRTPQVKNNSIQYLTRAINQYLQNKGNGFSNQVDEEKKVTGEKKKTHRELAIYYIENIVQLWHHSESLLKNIFNNDILVQKERDKAFQNVLNPFQDSPYYLSIYCDEFLKKTKDYSETETNQKIQDIRNVFLYLYQRDEFFSKYQKWFASRQLNSTHLNDDAEKAMILEFKKEAGNAINNIEKMLQDLAASRDFTENNLAQIAPGQSVDFKILSINWQMNPAEDDDIKVPKQITGLLENFTNIYKQMHKGYNLEILFNQGSSDMQFVPTKGKRFLLECSTYQMLIIMAVQNAPEAIPIKELEQTTGIGKAFDNQYSFLIKNKVLVENSDKQVDFNFKFENKKKKISIKPKGKAVEKQKDNEEQAGKKREQHLIKIQRENVIDSNVVKIMKANRTFPHNSLQEETVRLITLFTPEPRMIRDRIASLIERGFIKRDENNIKQYIYIP